MSDHAIKLKPVPFDESEIIRNILEGNYPLYELLIRKYNHHLYKLGRSYKYNHEDTQDLMQDTFIDAFLNLSGFQHRSSFKTWLFKIMINHCHKKKKKFSIKYEISADINENVIPMFSGNNMNDTNKMVLNHELKNVIEHALQELPEEYRLVFTLREMNGLSVLETSEALQITESNVKVRLHRAKSLLRHKVNQSYHPEAIFEFNLIYCDTIVRRVMSAINKIRRNGLTAKN